MVQTPEFIRILVREFEAEMLEHGEPEAVRYRVNRYLQTAIRFADTQEGIRPGNICDSVDKDKP